ncbi:MAG: DUF2799 domain-containing protein [Pseudomonadota bacterium]
MKAIHALIMLATAFTLGGCATGMSEQACLTADWRTVGFEDGVAGKTPSAISYYRNQCADAGVTPDLDEYLAGRTQGLETYCRPANGYRVGERGGQYHGVCDASSESDFLAAFNDGRELYILRRDVNRLERELDRAEETLIALETEIATLTLEAISDGLTPEQRLLLLNQSREATERKQIIEADIITIREELALSRERLQLYAAG